MSNTRKPNILYIMSDDHAANAISCYGGRLSKVAKTPNIDRIAFEGMRLDNCFCTNSICTPSRASILTGKYSQLNDVYTLDDDFDRSQQNVAELLQQSSYQTAIIGKWHLHTEPGGFDYYNVLPGQGRYHDPLLKEKGKPWQYRSKGGEVHKGYVTDIITDICLDWLKDRNKDKSFFLMCHNKAPHGLWEYADRHTHLYQDIEIPEPASLWEDKRHRSPGSREYGSTISTHNKVRNMVSRMEQRSWPTGRLDTGGMDENQRTRAAYQKYLKDYLRCVAAIDENVGRLLDYLDKEGLAEDTVVIYTSDQGMFLGEHDYSDKRWIFEESLRMPFVVRYPEEIEPTTVNDDIILNVDFAPTFLDYADKSTPSEMQGRSFRANLARRTPSNWPKSMYYRYWMHRAHHDVPAHYGIRTKRYKLIFFYGLPLDARGARNDPMQPGWELYDLKKDPYELKNVYNDPSYMDVVKQLKSQLLHLKEKLGDADEKYPELMKVREKYWQ